MSEFKTDFSVSVNKDLTVSVNSVNKYVSVC